MSVLALAPQAAGARRCPFSGCNHTPQAPKQAPLRPLKPPQALTIQVGTQPVELPSEHFKTHFAPSHLLQLSQLGFATLQLRKYWRHSAVYREIFGECPARGVRFQHLQDSH